MLTRGKKMNINDKDIIEYITPSLSPLFVKSIFEILIIELT